MANYELPQVRVFQDLEASIEPSQRAMLPTIIGQRKDLIRYDEDTVTYDEFDGMTEREMGALGDYVGDNVTFEWPNLGANSTVLQDSVRIYGEDVYVGIQKAQVLDNIAAISPLHDDFDVDDYFTPLVDGQENVFVFLDDSHDDGINLSSLSSLYRAPEVGDFITVRQTSQQTLQTEDDGDWTAQITGLVETELPRGGANTGGVSDPVEDTSNVLKLESTSTASTIAVLTDLSGDIGLQLDYKVMALSDIADNNVGAGTDEFIDTLNELVLNKACSYGLFDLADLDYKIRISNVTSTMVDVTITSTYYNETLSMSFASLVRYDDKLSDDAWFNDTTFLHNASSAAITDITSLGGVVVDDMFLLYAVPKKLSTSEYSAGTTVARTSNVATVATLFAHGLLEGDTVTIACAGDATFDGVATLLASPGDNDFTYTNAGEDAVAQAALLTTTVVRSNANVATVTAVAHGLIEDDVVTILCDDDDSFEGSAIVLAVPTDDTFTYSSVGDEDAVDTQVTIKQLPVKNDSYKLNGSLKVTIQKYDATPGVDDRPEVSSDQFDSTTDTVYTVEVVEGGAKDITLGDSNFTPTIKLRVSTNNSLDPVEVITAVIGTTGDIVMDLGTKSLELTFKSTPEGTSDYIIALAKGDMWTIECQGRAGDDLVGFITDKNFEFFRDMESQQLDVEILEKIESVNIPSVENWEIDGDGTGITFNTGAQVYLSTVDAEVYISTADLFMQYEAVNNTNTGDVMVITTSTDDRLGIDDPENPLGYGVRKAILNSQGVPVIAVPVDQMESADFEDALAQLSLNNNAYQIVPLTFDTELQNKVIAHCLSMSTELMDLWRVAYISTEIGSEYGLLTVDGDYAEITGSFVESSGSETDPIYNKLVLDSSVVGVSFLDSNVKAGHTLRYDYGEDMYGDESYSELTVLSVMNATELLVLGDYGGVSQSLTVAIYKDTDADDVIYEVGNRSEGLYSRRVNNVYPSILVDDADRVVPGYFGAAALAGLAGGVDPHQGLTNAKILGFTEASTIAPMRRMDIFKLNELAGFGVTILVGEAADIGVRHELTTSTLDRKNRETMITRNLDSLSYQYFDGLSPFIGIANVTPEFVEKVRTELKSLGGYIIASTRKPLIGSQMISCEIDSVSQNEVLSDKIDIYLSPVLPFPFNYGDIHLQI